MKLPAKITLLFFVLITAFNLLLTSYYYKQLTSTFHQEAETRMKFAVQSRDQQIKRLSDDLSGQMKQLASNLFTEEESVLAGLLTTPPEYSHEVIGFAGKLLSRTNLDFLYVISTDGIILSDSENPAAYGALDPLAQFPSGATAFADGPELPTLQYRTSSSFGRHQLSLRGGYLIRPDAFPGVAVQKINEGAAPPKGSPFQNVRVIKDYRGRPAMALVASYSEAPLKVRKQELLRNSTIFIIFALLTCILAGYLLSRWITRPIERLRDAAMQKALGAGSVRAEEGGSEEIDELAFAFNRMVEQLEENQKKLIQTERIAAWQEIARHLAHEIKNPLTPIRTSIVNLQLSMEKAPERFPEIFRESSASIMEEVEKLRRLADEFARFARLPAPALRLNQLNEVIRTSLVLYSGNPSAEIEFVPREIPEFEFDADQITEVIHNLLKNALEAIESGRPGRILIKTGVINSGDRSQVQLTLSDNGQGMDEEIKHQIFKPYYTTKVKGTGLGLSIVQRIVSEHGGEIFVESEPARGTRFDIRLPLR